MRLHLTAHQRAFLKALETSLKPIDGIIDEMRVRPNVLAVWLNNNDFRKAMKNFRRRTCFISDLDIARIRRHASSQISAMAFGQEPIDEKREPFRRLLMELIKLPQRRAVRTKPKPPEPDGGKGYHESVGPEEAEELLGHLGAD